MNSRVYWRLLSGPRWRMFRDAQGAQNIDISNLNAEKVVKVRVCMGRRMAASKGWVTTLK